jgi:hypothetical protein
MSVIAPVFSFGLNGYAGSGLALQDKAEMRAPRHPFFMDLSGLWSIHHGPQRYPLHGSVDDLARDLLSLRVCQTPDRGGFGGDRRGASIPRSQSFNADASRETLARTKGVNGGVKAGQWGGASMAAILA